MRVSALLLIVVACKAEPPPPPPAPPVAPSQLDVEDQRHRAKAAELGLARADTADMEHVDAFLCGALIATVTTTKVEDERKAAAASMTSFGCRDRPEWAAVVTARVKEMGMPDVEQTSRKSAQAWLCKQLATASSAAANEKSRAALRAESEIHDCGGR